MALEVSKQISNFCCKITGGIVGSYPCLVKGTFINFVVRSVKDIQRSFQVDELYLIHSSIIIQGIVSDKRVVPLESTVHVKSNIDGQAYWDDSNKANNDPLINGNFADFWIAGENVHSWCYSSSARCRWWEIIVVYNFLHFLKFVSEFPIVLKFTFLIIVQLLIDFNVKWRMRLFQNRIAYEKVKHRGANCNKIISWVYNDIECFFFDYLLIFPGLSE